MKTKYFVARKHSPVCLHKIAKNNHVYVWNKNYIGRWTHSMLSCKDLPRLTQLIFLTTKQIKAQYPEFRKAL